MVYKCFPNEFYAVLYSFSNLDIEDRNLDSCCCEAVHRIHVDTTLPKVTLIYSFIVCQINLLTFLKTFEMQILDFNGSVFVISHLSVRLHSLENS
jgi:hypothetical protein